MSQAWRQVRVRVPAALAEDVRLLMQRRAGNAVAVEDEYLVEPPDESNLTGSCQITAWFDGGTEAAGQAEALVADLWMAAGLNVPELRAAQVSDTTREQWLSVEARYARPITVGRIRIIPAGTTPVPIAGAGSFLELEIAAGGAFGSGLHPSTRGVLSRLQSIPMNGKRVLDVGTGSGVLAVAASKLGAAEVVAIDIDREAVAVARSNAERNRCAEAIIFAPAGLSAQLLERFGRFDLVLANITAAAHAEMLPLYAQAAAGRIVLGGIYQPRWAGLARQCAAAGLDVLATTGESEWLTVECSRPGCAAEPTNG